MFMSRQTMVHSSMHQAFSCDCLLCCYLIWSPSLGTSLWQKSNLMKDDKRCTCLTSSCQNKCNVLFSWSWHHQNQQDGPIPTPECTRFSSFLRIAHLSAVSFEPGRKIRLVVFVIGSLEHGQHFMPYCQIDLVQGEHYNHIFTSEVDFPEYNISRINC